MQPQVLFAISLIAVGLAACELPRDIKPIPTAAPAADLANTKLAPIKLSRVTFAIPRGKTIGSSYFDYFSCGGYGSGPVTWSSDPASVQSTGLADAFYRELTSAHFKVVGDPVQLFNINTERADYLIGAQVTDIEANICNRVDPFYWIPLGGQRGEATIDVTWQVFSNLAQRIVYTTKTRGYTKMDHAVPDGGKVLIRDAFAAAAANLAGDKGLIEILRRDHPAAPTEVAALRGPTLQIDGARPLADPIARNIGRIQAASVTILIGDAGHGSGFFISDQGHILTNYHVVGNATTAPVRLSNGATIVGRVLRSHEARDVALIKIDAVGTQPLALRLKPAQVAEPVYALGTPLDRALSNTLTRGIVNAVRRFEGENSLPLIQADVSIHPGNSGGPLLDASGNVVGMSVAKYKDAEGINFFIPIDDALEKLSIEIKS